MHSIADDSLEGQNRVAQSRAVQGRADDDLRQDSAGVVNRQNMIRHSGGGHVRVMRTITAGELTLERGTTGLDSTQTLYLSRNSSVTLFEVES